MEIRPPRKSIPTFSNIYKGDENNEEFFSDIPFYAAYLKSIADLFEYPCHDVLDIGCGRGEYKESLKKNFRHKMRSYTGVDPDEGIVHKAKDPDISTGDLLTFKSRKKYDLVLCHSVLQYVENLDEAFAKLRNLVRKSGFVSVFQTMTLEDYELYKKKVGWEDDYAWVRKKDTYRRAMLKYFDVIGYGLLIPKGQQKQNPYTIDKLFLFE